MASLATTTGPEIAVIPDGQVTDPSEARSALEENILSKGKHSYYYAHKSNLGQGADTKNYGTPPRLLKTETKKDGVLRALKIITDYAWADCGKKIKVYVTLEGICDIEEEDSVTLVHDKTSFCLRLNDVKGMDHTLSVPVLNDEITKATFKIKHASNKIVIFLTKENDFSWYDLKKDI